MLLLGTLFALAFVAFAVWIWRERQKRLARSRIVLVAAYAIGVVILALYGGKLIYYATQIGYFDHLQASVAAIGSRVVLHGGPTYPDWRSGDVYTVLYGPLLYWVNGLAMLGGIGATKLAGVIAFLVGVLLTCGAVRRMAGGTVPGALVLALAVAQLAPMQWLAYWNRAEPYLYLSGALSIGAMVWLRSRPLASMIAIGAVAGTAAGIKISGFLYAVPAALGVVALASGARERIRLVLAGGAAGLATLAFPALLDGSIVENYPSHLSMVAAGHEFARDAVQLTVKYALFLLFAPLFGLVLRRPVLARSDYGFAAGIALALVAAVIGGSKIGAGPHHLIPLAPALLLLTVRFASAEAKKPAAIPSRNAFALVVLVCSVWQLGSAAVLLPELASTWRSDRRLLLEKQFEFLRFLSAYPDAEVGVSNQQTYPDTYFRPLQVARNGRLHLDSGAWMDLQHAGAEEAPLLELIETCAVRDWLIPQGPPFTIANLYSGLPLFSDDFRRAFTRRYEAVAHGRHYSVWRCDPAVSAGRDSVAPSATDRTRGEDGRR
jgi:hypothetical protein